MTYPSQPGRAGLAPWAKWTLFGCGGCLTVAILAGIVVGIVSWQYLKKHIEFIDVSKVPDPPLSAPASQLLPSKVGSFVRKKIGRPSGQNWGNNSQTGWQGSYLSGKKRVELVVMSTTEAQSSRSNNSPFGNAMKRQQGNPDLGFRMNMKIGNEQLDMVFWSKPNWTVAIQSPDMAAKEFATAYRPATGGKK